MELANSTKYSLDRCIKRYFIFIRRKFIKPLLFEIHPGQRERDSFRNIKIDVVATIKIFFSFPNLVMKVDEKCKYELTEIKTMLIIDICFYLPTFN